MLRPALIALALLCFWPGKAEPKSSEIVFSVAQLLDACTRADYEWIGFCNGYLQAAVDATGDRDICFPQNHTRNDVYNVIVPKLKNAPGLKDTSAIQLVQALLRDAFPCK